jgi:hypothetical protein
MSGNTWLESRRPSQAAFVLPQMKANDDTDNAELTGQDDDNVRQTVKQDIAQAQQQVVVERPDLASCAATVTRTVTLYKGCNAETSMQQIDAGCRVRLFPDTRVDDWIGARVVCVHSGAISDGWLHSNLADPSLFVDFQT